MKRFLRRCLLLFCSSVLVILGLMLVLPKMFGKQINVEVSKLIRESIKGTVQFDEISLSFYKRFPNLTAVVVNPIVEGIVVDSLVPTRLFEAKSVDLGVNVVDLLRGQLNFDKIFIDTPIVNVKVNEQGEANYSVFVSSAEQEEDSASLQLAIKQLKVLNGSLLYEDVQGKLSFVAKSLNYDGKGAISEDVFVLESIADIESFDFSFDNVHYIKEKPIKASLETLVDTKSLRFAFKRNDLRIKELPVSFNGFFGFIEGGYDMLFDVKTDNASLSEVLSIVPPQYQEWFSSTSFLGETSAKLLLEGKYVINDSIKPNLSFDLSLFKGYVKHADASNAIEDLDIAFKMSMEGLDMENLQIALDTLHFNLAGRSSQLNFFSKGYSRLQLDSDIKLTTSLGIFSKAVGLRGFAMDGELSLIGDVKGIFSKDVIVRRSLRKETVDTIVSSIPQFNLDVKLANGFFKLAQLPKAIDRVDLEMQLTGNDSLYKNVSIDISRLNLVAMDNKVEGALKVKNLHNLNMDGYLRSKIDLENIKEFLPLEGIQVGGTIDFNGTVRGTFEPKRSLFPIVNAHLKVEHGFAKLDRLPELPINDVIIDALINSRRGSLSDLTIKILPVRFKLAEQDFSLSASLFNLTNLNYNVRSKGSLDIGKLYQVFKEKGLDVRGKIHTNLFLKGSQQAALTGNFDELKNSGRFEVDNIAMTSEMFPKPLFIRKGVFKFFKEQVKFDRFEAVYGSSVFSLTGGATNVINHMLKQDTLKGSFDLQTKSLNVDEFMVFAPANAKNVKTKVATVGAGVIQVPKNVNLQFNAVADEIKYQDYVLTNFKGSLAVDQGKIMLKETLFDLIGTSVGMTGTYIPQGLRKALFNYHIKASNFDIQRAYHEITLFRDMVSMAKNAYGQVSLDYTLSGELNSHMFPVMSSLIGGGTLSLDDIQFRGFKLLGAIADKTEAKSLEEGSVSDVVIHSTVEDNVLTIPRTRMKMAGFRPRFEGQVSLDGELNIGLRLGLPPLGIIGIPMRITGNAEDFKIQMGRYKANEDLHQSEEDEEDEEYDVNSVNDPLPEVIQTDSLKNNLTLRNRTE